MATDRVRVLRATVRVLVRQPNAPMDELAKAAGISRATLHRLVPSRNALVKQLAELALADARAAIERARPEQGEPVAAVRRLVAELVPIADLWAFLMGENQIAGDPEMDQLWAELDLALIGLFRRGQESGAFRVELPAEFLTDALSSLLAGTGWAVQHGRLAAKDANRVLTELLLNGAVRRNQS
ncbi:TetR/AcrR family transcriptional regulator [Kutzneria viridogrisea]|nr:TetR/AcrR family transcriptional regulator [Kutzneria albida]MBA8929096.1 AcrR family transcriptional regulator [Kutzneria viridogrisea]